MKRNNNLLVMFIVGVFLLGGLFLLQSSTTPQSQIVPTVEPDTSGDSLQLETFYLDEVGEPLDETTLDEAVSRNEARIEDEEEQIDEDVVFIDELNEAMNDVNEPGISE